MLKLARRSPIGQTLCYQGDYGNGGARVEAQVHIDTVSVPQVHLRLTGRWSGAILESAAQTTPPESGDQHAIRRRNYGHSPSVVICNSSYSELTPRKNLKRLHSVLCLDNRSPFNILRGLQVSRINISDMVGRRFGRLFVKSIASISPAGRKSCLCICDCGVEVVRLWANLTQSEKDGRRQSCGCWAKEITGQTFREYNETGENTKHGLTATRTYVTWQAMLARCNRPQHPSYPNYGGRGIHVCERWSSFQSFVADMGIRPPNTSIDRINNDGNYEPGNCRWATQKEQTRNTRVNALVMFQGREVTLAELAEIAGVSIGAITHRIKRLRLSGDQAVAFVKFRKRWMA